MCNFVNAIDRLQRITKAIKKASNPQKTDYDTSNFDVLGGEIDEIVERLVHLRWLIEEAEHEQQESS